MERHESHQGEYIISIFKYGYLHLTLRKGPKVSKTLRGYHK